MTEDTTPVSDWMAKEVVGFDRDGDPVRVDDRIYDRIRGDGQVVDGNGRMIYVLFNEQRRATRVDSREVKRLL